MSIETVFEAKIIPHTDNHWDIVSARYSAGELYIQFQDGTEGSLPISYFPALVNATDTDFADLQVSPCGLIIENERLEWDYSEAGLYKLVTQNRVEG